MTNRLFILIFLLFCSTPLFAQSVDTAWVRRYNGPADTADVAQAIAVDGSGNVYVTGFCDGPDMWTPGDYATIRYYANGDTAWVRRYNGSADTADQALAIAVDGSGNVYVTGRSFGSGTWEDYATIKYYANGDTAWVRRYNAGNDWDYACAIAVDGSGNVYVTGSSVDSAGTSVLDYATIKYNSNGDTAWVRRYNGPTNSMDIATDLAIDASGNVYVTGKSGHYPNEDYATVKYDSSGNELWVRRYNGPEDDYDQANTIAVDGSGNAYVTGYSRGSGTEHDYATIKYNSDGDTVWVRRYNGPGNSLDEATAIAVDGSGNVYVTGYSFQNNSVPYNPDYATIKYYPSGDTAWVRRYYGPGDTDDNAWAIALDGSGNVYVTGRSAGDGTSFDYATIKYNSEGNTVWVRRYNGPGNSIDESTMMALDGYGNVYVTGKSEGSETDYDYATIKYVQSQQISDTLSFTAYSPVDLIVTDPSGDSIGVDFNTIPGATYDTLTDYNGDEELDDRVTIPNPLVGEYTVKIVGEPGSVGGSYTLAVKLNGNEDTPMIAGTAPGPGEVDTVYYTVIEYLKGDANTDGSTSISDVIFLINYLFKGGTPPSPLLLGDANCCKEGDGSCTVVNLSVSDVIYLINYLFKGGDAPCS